MLAPTATTQTPCLESSGVPLLSGNARLGRYRYAERFGDGGSIAWRPGRHNSQSVLHADRWLCWIGQLQLHGDRRQRGYDDQQCGGGEYLGV